MSALLNDRNFKWVVVALALLFTVLFVKMFRFQYVPAGSSDAVIEIDRLTGSVKLVTQLGYLHLDRTTDIQANRGNLRGSLETFGYAEAGRLTLDDIKSFRADTSENTQKLAPELIRALASYRIDWSLEDVQRLTTLQKNALNEYGKTLMELDGLGVQFPIAEDLTPQQERALEAFKIAGAALKKQNIALPSSPYGSYRIPDPSLPAYWDERRWVAHLYAKLARPERTLESPR